LRSARFWNFAQRRMVVSYRRFDTTYRLHITVSTSRRKPEIAHSTTLSSFCLCPEDWGSVFLQTLGYYLPMNADLHPRRTEYSKEGFARLYS